MRKLTNEQTDMLTKALKFRFEKNMDRYSNTTWENFFEKISNNPEKMWLLEQMEKTGGEPDVIKYDEDSNEYIFCDCSVESPVERRNVCYDREALESRKNFKPNNNTIDMAKEMGIEILNEEDYKYLQKFGQFDLKTSSWIKTPAEIRKLGGAIFGDRRYNNVFIYHNGADSYYAGRGFRGPLRV
jgi:hypothetical protein